MSELSLRAGPLTILYQDGFLRYMSHGKNVILRMIYFALRDENWGTYLPMVENEKFDIQEDQFKIQYDCFHELHNKRIYHWKALISGNQNGQITFELHGVALEDVLKNRAGLCILHPIQGVAGHACETMHEDGKGKPAVFPEFVSASDPFKDLTGMRWKNCDTWWSLTFEGDTYETEDQRNWTDASFKTFCTPLTKPFPVQLKKGDVVHQKVSLSPESELPSLHQANPLIEIQSTSEKVKLPFIGISASSETDVLNSKAVALLRALALSHYRIEVTPSHKNWISQLLIDCENANKLDLPLEVVLHLTSDYRMDLINSL